MLKFGVTEVSDVLLNTPKTASLKLKCQDYWEIMQLAAIDAICHAPPNSEYRELPSAYETRAKHIAGVYAQAYLEHKRLTGKPSKMGRYYWMGLGAFAVKTVRYLFKDPRSKLPAVGLSKEVIFAGTKPKEILAKGNLWLYLEIMPWHLGYSTDSLSFNKCTTGAQKYSRDSGTYQVELDKLLSEIENEFHDYSQGKINYLKLSDNIKTGFELVGKIEKATRESDKKDAQFQHLITIAYHEQMILQKLCWDDPVLRASAVDQRAAEFTNITVEKTNDPDYIWKKGAAPQLKLTFTSQSDTTSKELTSWAHDGKNAPDVTNVEDYNSRMAWIKDAAEKYHKLMYNDKQGYMLGELRTMAGWAPNHEFK